MKLNKYFKTSALAENKKKVSVSLENVADIFAESYGQLFNRLVYLTCAVYAVYLYYDRFTRYRVEGLSVSEILGTLFSNTMLSMMLAGCVMICLLFVLSPIIAIRRRRIMKSKEMEQMEMKRIEMNDQVEHVESIETVEVIQVIQKPIDEKKLGFYFTASFKGMGQSINHMPNLLEQLEHIRKSTPTDMARVAYMIHESSHVTKLPKKFSKWMRIFFEILDVEVPADISKNKYKPTKEIKEKFYFLK